MFQFSTKSLKSAAFTRDQDHGIKSVSQQCSDLVQNRETDHKLLAGAEHAIFENDASVFALGFKGAST